MTDIFTDNWKKYTDINDGDEITLIIVISNILNICLTIFFFCLTLQYSAYRVILPLIITFLYYIPTLYYV